MWELPTPEPGQTLTQCWFSGCHSDVGGGRTDLRQADISLTWMISQLSDYLHFDRDQLQMQYYHPHKATSDVRPWSCGQINNALTPTYWLAGTEKRHPLDYNAYDHDTGKEKVPRTPLKTTNESIHASVRLRIGLGGKGPDDKGIYRPEPLAAWSVNGVEDKPRAGPVSLQEIQAAQKHIYWQVGADSSKRLPEAVLSEREWSLLKSFSPSIESKFLSTVTS
jgi:hypothetical protein